MTEYLVAHELVHLHERGWLRRERCMICRVWACELKQ